MKPPLIGITVDNVDSDIHSGKYESNVAYSQMVAKAGGLPLLLPQEVSLAEYFVEVCDGLMFTGGDDARSDDFGVSVHPDSRCIDAQRQAFELALLDALAKKPVRPVLGVCLGMQLMALHAGGRMNQHLPDILPNAVQEHQNNHPHAIVVEAASVLLPAVLLPGSDVTNAGGGIDVSHETVPSSHHQAVESAGRLRVIAHSPDGVVEAIDDPARPFYLGVQWHPERSVGLLNFDLIKRFVDACRQPHA